MCCSPFYTEKSGFFLGKIEKLQIFLIFRKFWARWDVCSWGILPIQYPYPSTNSANRVFNSEETPEDEEPQNAVDIGVQEAQDMNNIEEDEEYIKVEEDCKKLKEKLIQEFSDVFREELKPEDKVNVPPVQIEVDEEADVAPINVKCPRDVHIQIRKVADEEIKDHFAAGVIAESKNPTVHCAYGMFCCKKTKDGSVEVRLVADFQGVNKIIKRPGWPNEASSNLLKRIPPEARVFSAIDWASGYYQVKIAEEFRELFTFVVPQGKFHFCRLPQGTFPASDLFNIATDSEIRNVAGIIKNIDDLLVSGRSIKEIEPLIRRILKIFRKRI